MSSEILRRAAALMRERAEAADPSPWWKYQRTSVFGIRSAPTPHGAGIAVGYTAPRAECNAEHIASWHPDVALAIAAELEKEGAAWERVIADYPDLAEAAEQNIQSSGWLHIARAYLGEAL